jgi:hypothetical protein
MTKNTPPSGGNVTRLNQTRRKPSSHYIEASLVHLQQVQAQLTVMLTRASKASAMSPCSKRELELHEALVAYDFALASLHTAGSQIATALKQDKAGARS